MPYWTHARGAVEDVDVQYVKGWWAVTHILHTVDCRRWFMPDSVSWDNSLIFTPSDPVIRDVLSGATLENNSFVNPSPNSTIELRCEVDTLRGQPHWVFFAANQSQQVVIKSTSDLFVLEENATYSILRSRPGSSPASLEGLLCCLANDGFDSEDFFAKCVQLTTKPLKGETPCGSHYITFVLCADVCNTIKCLQPLNIW